MYLVQNHALEAEPPALFALAFADFSRVREKYVWTGEVNAERHRTTMERKTNSEQKQFWLL